MKSLCGFLERFATIISWVHSSFDRVLFKGHLPISRIEYFTMFVDRVLHQRRCDFLKITAPRWSERLVDHAKAFAARSGRPYEYHAEEVDKDKWAKALRDRDQIVEGLIGVLCVMEACRTYKLKFAEGRPAFRSAKTVQRVLYYYFVDPCFGFMHVRLQTWAPFTCQVYVNGHEFTAREMKRRGLAFLMHDNAFVRLDDPKAAQKCADRFVDVKWPSVLERFARMVNPLLQSELRGLEHYWATDQAEYATDVRFVDSTRLRHWYARMVAYAVSTFTPKSIFGFLGRAWHGSFNGEMHMQIQRNREWGTCVKHTMKRNRLKMYDKFAMILRVETIINQPGEFKVYRERRHRDGTTSRGMYAMCKGVANLRHYQSQSLACNGRYLDALSAVSDPSSSYESLRELTEPCRRKNRMSRGFNPASEGDAALFAALLDGDHIQGFRNAEIRSLLHGGRETRADRRRASAATGRVFKRLQVRKLIEKVPRTRRWRVTAQGRKVMGEALAAFRQYGSQPNE